MNGEDRPIDALNTSRGKRVLVKLKNNIELSGTLKAHDLHLNMWLVDVELKREEETIKYKDLLVRGDTVLYVVP
ncbi:MAG: small nuclear ribonucleoprotein [Candidatus Aenigmarchaeota archaeon ex4484_56]|nr:MAG: small nuclear ribonucleoprotein [Candidatus Aenigmarchaeota archaeon ex4484_56]